MEIKEFKLIGLRLPGKTTNENGQSNIDIGNLWQQFEKEQWFARIPGKLDEELLAVYFDYEGDHMQPFSYFIGSRVSPDTKVPEGMSSLVISAGSYRKFTAKGKMPFCIGIAWKEIWEQEKNRAFDADFEVYGEKSRDWENAEVDIFISVK